MAVKPEKVNAKYWILRDERTNEVIANTFKRENGEWLASLTPKIVPHSMITNEPASTALASLQAAIRVNRNRFYEIFQRLDDLEQQLSDDEMDYFDWEM